MAPNLCAFVNHYVVFFTSSQTLSCVVKNVLVSAIKKCGSENGFLFPTWTKNPIYCPMYGVAHPSLLPCVWRGIPLFIVICMVWHTPLNDLLHIRWYLVHSSGPMDEHTVLWFMRHVV